MAKGRARDIEKSYTTGELAKKLRRFADSLESGRQFEIQIKGRKIRVPKGAVANIEHESGKTEEEIEFQIKWKKRTS